MPGRIRQSTKSLADIDAIWDFIARDSVGAADKLIDRLSGALRTLADNPLAGRARPELAENLRSFPIVSYVVFYIPSADGIEIIRVLHGARDIQERDFGA